MNRSLTVIVSGPPCTGKTTLGRRLAEDLRLPFLSKDLIKEKLFDTLGWSDREWSRKLGIASIEVLYLLTEMELEAGRSFIVESNFRAEHATARFLDLKRRYDFEAVQVQCRTEPSVLIERYRSREESGKRHPGHVGPLTYDELEADLLQGLYKPLDIGGMILDVDTTDFSRVNYVALLAAIRAAAVSTGP